MKYPITFVFVISSLVGLSQDVVINGTVRDAENNRAFLSLMVINKRTGQGQLAKSGGVFVHKAMKSDTVLIAARGYRTYYLTMADSAPKGSYHVEVVLEKLNIALAPVDIFPRREISEIEEDKEELGYDEQDYMLSGKNPFASPITYLYERFSRYEQQKRLAYKLMNDERRRQLLKELLTLYMDYEIIDIAPDQFDEFIEYMGITDQQLKTMPSYDFIMLVKKKFRDFERESDYY